MDNDLVKFKKAVEASGEVIFMTDPNGLFTYVNPQFISVYGYAAEEVLGKSTPRILKSSLCTPEFYADFWKKLKSGIVVKVEMINKTKAGMQIIMDATINPVYDDKQQLLGFLAIQHDITIHKKNEQELKQKVSDLEAISRVTVDRELKMVELKNQIAKLTNQSQSHT